MITAAGKHRDKVESLIEHYPALKRRFNDILLACAHELRDAVSSRLIEASRKFAAVDPDNEVAWHEAMDALYAAERDFLAQHANTVVEL